MARDFGPGKTEWEPWARCNSAVNLLQVQWSRDPGRGAMGQETWGRDLVVVALWYVQLAGTLGQVHCDVHPSWNVQTGVCLLHAAAV